jgi:hypothetical protein
MLLKSMPRQNGNRANTGGNNMDDNEELNTRGIYETILKDIKLKFNPENFSFVIQLPVSKSKHLGKSTIKSQNKSQELLKLKNHDKQYKVIRKDDSNDEFFAEETDIEFIDLDLDELEVDDEPVRVKIHLKAYMKMALHALKYANDSIKKKKLG